MNRDHTDDIKGWWEKKTSKECNDKNNDINFLMYMDGINLFAKDEKVLET